MAAKEWKTLKQRVEWVLARKPELENQSAWAKKAGVASGISTAKTREKQKAGFRIELDTAEKLAKVAGVDPTWLRTGEGLPDGSKQAMAPYDTHAMRLWAADMLAQLHGVEPIQAWWLMRDIELTEPTRDGFLIEANRRLRGETPPPELTEEKVNGFTAQFIRAQKPK